MVSRLDTLGRIGAKAALRLRRELGVAPGASLDPFVVAEFRGVTVRLRPEPSLEGMYIKSPGPLVLLTTLRPRGRRNFTLAHELGHHEFEHGTQVDQYLDTNAHDGTDEEVVANMFASHLLMPAVAVRRALEAWGVQGRAPTPEEAYLASSQLGVGYTTLLNHLRWNLSLASRSSVDALQRVTPASIKQRITGIACPGVVVPVSRSTTGPVDVRIDDVLLVPQSLSLDGDVMKPLQGTPPTGYQLVRAVRPGIGRLFDSEWATFVRIEPREYVGLAKYRFLERDNDN